MKKTFLASLWPCKGLISAVFALPSIALATVHEDLSFSTYSANAQEGKTIYESLIAVSPIKSGDKRFLGHTKWFVNWKFRFLRDDGRGCKITRVDVYVSGKILLPELIGGDAVKRKKFAVFLENLRTHEMGHYQIGLSIGKEIERGLLALPAHPNCDTLKENANRHARDILTAREDADEQYDALTKHGKTQGAWLTD